MSTSGLKSHYQSLVFSWSTATPRESAGTPLRGLLESARDMRTRSLRAYTTLVSTRAKESSLYLFIQESSQIGEGSAGERGGLFRVRALL